MRIISGIYRGRTLKTVQGPGYRPAMSRVREALFSMLESRGIVWSKSTALDLFAGSGSLAFECLSRGALKAVLVENSAQAVRCLEDNMNILGIDNAHCSIMKQDVLKILNTRPANPFDVIFIDPPYGKNLLEPTLNRLMRNNWVHEQSIITAEVESSIKFMPDTAHEKLGVLTERTFGQTRVILWELRKSE